ncbi:MAG: hypothetical protein GTN99_08570 [Candidatus Dadabacteria bacterium]|nr:hypothetical protein [Candidatus Dadabacteria bacterium]
MQKLILRTGLMLTFIVIAVAAHAQDNNKLSPEKTEAVDKSALMPAWETVLSEDDIVNIIAYLRTLSGE